MQVAECKDDFKERKMNTECLNLKWQFFKNVEDVCNLSTMQGEEVDIPHTWNNLDGQDGGADYFRGSCAYQKVVEFHKKQDMEYYIEFQGVNSIAKVYINKQFVGEHFGGFSTFRFNITEPVIDGDNTITVLVDNSPNDYIYPQTADFTFFGGVYRGVFIHEVQKTRFNLDYYGGNGVMITPILQEDNTAKVNIKAFVTNPKAEQIIEVEISLNGCVIEKHTTPSTCPEMDILIENPQLWDGVDNPVLYNAQLSLYCGDEVTDCRKIKFGIRKFYVNENGFYLNGRLYPLRGVSRHQDREDKGWAIKNCDHEEDIELIKEVGANSVRLAHYQHDQYFYDLCDENGLVVWAEIPYISSHLAKGNENAINQMRELIVQNYNHSSIMFWGVSNEITIGGEVEGIYALHNELNDICHEMDKTRLTTMANVTMLDTDSELLNISDIMAYNHYFGWYVGEVEDNAVWLDEFIAKFPKKPIGLSEYGCEGILKWHTSTPKQGDYTEEYQAYFHEAMLKIIKERPYLWATYVWNMFDFGVDSRNEGGVAGRNNKGLVTYDRKHKKDSFYIYKAYWSKQPFVHITSKRYENRAEKITKIKVYSNLNEVTLFVNDEKFESKNGKYVFEFNVPLEGENNQIRAVSGECEDFAVFNYVAMPDEKYIFKNQNQISNWFEKDGKKIVFDYPENAFSIKDKLSEIMTNEQGRNLVMHLLDEMFSTEEGGMKMQVNSNMLKLVGGMSFERIASMAGDKLNAEKLYEINKKLNEIKK